MKKRLLGIAGVALLLGACDADRPAGITQPSLRTSLASVSDPSELCARCVLGPQLFVRRTGAPLTETIRFAAAPAPFVVDIDNLGSQGASADVSLNGVSLVADGIPAHFNQLVVLRPENTLVVRLTGKPGSQLRVAIWQRATLDAVTLAPSTTLQIDGLLGGSFRATITNHTSAQIPDVSIETWLVQTTARRLAGRALVTCGEAAGVLSVARCVTTNSVRSTNGWIGDGTLVAGSALAVIRLVRGGSEALDSLVVPIVLTPPPPPAIIYVMIHPFSLVMLPGGHAQLTADVAAIGGAPTAVEWSVIRNGYDSVTVTPGGYVTAVSMASETDGYARGPTWIKATSKFNPLMWDEIPLTIYDWRLRTPGAPVEVATTASASHPTSVDLVASLCGDRVLVFEPPFGHVDFTALLNGIPVSIGSGTPSSRDIGTRTRCWDWQLTWTPGNAFGLGQQTVSATAPGFGFTTPVNTNITTVVP